MELSGDKILPVNRELVWKHLTDPEILLECIPGCSELTGTLEEGFEAVVTQKIGPVKATFKGMVKFEDIVVRQSYTMVGEGKGGAAGIASGLARVSFADSEEGTLLIYEVEAAMKGKIAQLGSRLVSGVAKKLADKFFTNFQEKVAELNPDNTIPDSS
ncbi:MAG: carbon monoxide dehydrogenase subunit G [Rhodobacteraceae bacterium]|nr:carbon monoxide dehydrogenase subunit G [Paracoccaceae bacterium]